MKFRQFGILLMVGGFLMGHLMSVIVTREGYEEMASAAGAANLADIAKTTARGLSCQLYGDIVALVGLVVYFYGVLTSRGGRNTTVVVGDPV